MVKENRNHCLKAVMEKIGVLEEYIYNLGSPKLSYTTESLTTITSVFILLYLKIVRILLDRYLGSIGYYSLHKLELLHSNYKKGLISFDTNFKIHRKQETSSDIDDYYPEDETFVFEQCGLLLHSSDIWSVESFYFNFAETTYLELQDIEYLSTEYFDVIREEILCPQTDTLTNKQLEIIDTFCEFTSQYSFALNVENNVMLVIVHSKKIGLLIQFLKSECINTLPEEYQSDALAFLEMYDKKILPFVFCKDADFFPDYDGEIAWMQLLGPCTGFVNEPDFLTPSAEFSLMMIMGEQLYKKLEPQFHFSEEK